MVLGINTTLSDAQAITASAPSTNVLDLGALGKAAYGQAQIKTYVGLRHIPFLIQCVEDFATLTSLKISVESDDNSGFSSPKEILSQTVAVADLKAGFKSNIRSLPLIRERFVRVNFTVNGANATAGKITAAIALAVDGHEY